MNNREEIRQFIIENFLYGDERNFNPGDSFFESGRVKFDGFLELISFLEERFNIFFKDGELIPAGFDTFEKINKNVILKTSGETN